MAEKEEQASSGGDNTTRPTDWEVVSLTASAYAASPGGPKPVVDDEAETSHPLYMSRHFMVPPSEDKATKKIDSEFSLDQEAPGKEDVVSLKRLDSAKDDEFTAGLEFLEEEEEEQKGKTEENNIYKEDEKAFGGSHVYQQTEPQDDQVANSPPPWWKRSAASLISHAKETNTVWSIFIAAAVMGVVLLGQRWQHDRWQILQLKWESTIANEKAGRLMGPISRLKQAFVGGQRRDSFIRVSPQNDS